MIADYKQIELVIAAVVSGEEKLLEAFGRADDVHSLTSRGILESDPARKGRPVTEEEVKAFRPKAKMVSFGILYGITAKGLAWRIENSFGVRISVEEAQGMINRFLDTYPALKQWYLEECRKAERHDDVTHTLTGHRRLLDAPRATTATGEQTLLCGSIPPFRAARATGSRPQSPSYGRGEGDAPATRR